MKRSQFLSLLVGAVLTLPITQALAQESEYTPPIGPEAHSSESHRVSTNYCAPGDIGNGCGPVVPQPALKAGQTPTDPSTPPLTTKVNPKDGLTYVWLTPGKFKMGCSAGDADCDDDEKPVREVTIGRGYWIGQTLVTQAAYKRVTGENPSFFRDSDQLPVEKVEWGDAYEYCTSIGMRLPTEAEYEYAARAGSPAPRWGDLDSIAWYKNNSNERTHEVAQKKPNAWNLYDMLGNVWEYTTDPYKPENPVSVAMRGGSWMTRGTGIRTSYRGFDMADVKRKFTGFRCVGD